MKKLIFLFFITAAALSAQDITILAKGPIKGSTFIPDGLYVSNIFSSSQAKSYYDFNGDNWTFYEYTAGLARPVEKSSINTLFLQAGFSPAFAISLTVPYVLSHTANVNAEPGWNKYFDNDKSGGNGISDVWAHLMVLLWKNEFARLMVSGGAKFPTGSFPEDMEYFNISSTGSGDYEAELSLSSDIMPYNNFLLSLKAGYVLAFKRNAEILYGDPYSYNWKRQMEVKSGNRMQIQAVAVYNIGDLALGTGIAYSNSAEQEFMGQTKEKSGIHYLIIQPVASYRLFSQSFPLDISLDYSWMASGKNITRFNTFSFSISKIFGF